MHLFIDSSFSDVIHDELEIHMTMWLGRNIFIPFELWATTAVESLRPVIQPGDNIWMDRIKRVVDTLISVALYTTIFLLAIPLILASIWLVDVPLVIGKWIISQFPQDTSTHLENFKKWESQYPSRICHSDHKFMEDIVKLVASSLLKEGDTISFGRLPLTCRAFNHAVVQFSSELDINAFCPNVPILDIKLFEMTDHEEFCREGLAALQKLGIHKPKLIEQCRKLSPYVEDEQGVSILILREDKNFTLLEQIEAIAEKAKITLVCNDWDRSDLNKFSVKRTSVIVISNGPLLDIRDEIYANQKESVAGCGCEIPPYEVYLLHSILTSKIFKTSLYEGNHVISSTLTLDGNPFVVSSSSPDTLEINAFRGTNLRNTCTGGAVIIPPLTLDPLSGGEWSLL